MGLLCLKRRAIWFLRDEGGLKDVAVLAKYLSKLPEITPCALNADNCKTVERKLLKIFLTNYKLLDSSRS
jgi:hypothetical protein